METISRARIIAALTLAPLLAPVLFWASVLIIDAFTAKPLTLFSVGTFVIALVTGAPLAYVNAAIVVYSVWVLFGRDRLARAWPLLAGGTATGTVTMMLVTWKMKDAVAFVALGGFVGFISAGVFWLIAFYDHVQNRTVAPD